MRNLNEGILETIGNTPLIRLHRGISGCTFNLFAKLEGFNPGGSIKDRAAHAIISNAIDQGKIKDGTTIVESSSGNMGLGLAQICRYLGLRFICVIDPKTTAANVRLLLAFGAEVDLVSRPDPVTGEFLNARLNRVRELMGKIPNAYWPDQYSNVHNARAHHQTMCEIDTALGGRVDYLFCPTSTCGTLRGCAEYIRSNLKGRTQVIAVDAVGSVIFGGPAKKRLIAGHGAAVRPALYQDGLVDTVIQIEDLDCVVGCRRLLAREGLLVGGSSGGTLMAVEYHRELIPKDANCVVIFPDRGDRYLDTIFSDEWVESHFGEEVRGSISEIAIEAIEALPR
jgi:cysteine synthase A